jgi:hypothetical protein
MQNVRGPDDKSKPPGLESRFGVASSHSDTWRSLAAKRDVSAHRRCHKAKRPASPATVLRVTPDNPSDKSTQVPKSPVVEVRADPTGNLACRHRLSAAQAKSLARTRPAR